MLSEATQNRLIAFMVKRGFTKFTDEEAIEYLLDEIEALEEELEEKTLYMQNVLNIW